MTCVVIAQRDEATIAASLHALRAACAGLEAQIVVVVSDSPATAAAARAAMPEAEVLESAAPLLPGQARNLGLARARGRYVSFPGSHVTIDPAGLRARVAAHRAGHTMVTGTVLNGTRTWAGWAAFLLENADNLPGLPREVLDHAPVHCSYLRTALLEAGGFPPLRSGEDTAVNLALFARGHRACREPSIVLSHRSPCVTPRAFLRHQFLRGQGWGRVMLALHADGRLLSPPGLRHWVLKMLPPGRLLFVAGNVARTGDHDLWLRFLWTLPLTATGAVVGWACAWATFLAAISPAARRASLRTG